MSGNTRLSARIAAEVLQILGFKPTTPLTDPKVWLTIRERLVGPVKRPEFPKDGEQG